MPITTDTELVERVLMDHHQMVLPGDNPQQQLRDRIARNAQVAAIELWSKRDWRFRYVADTLVVAANGYNGDLPADWANEGRQGYVFNAATNQRLTWKRLGYLDHMIQSAPSDRGDPIYYSVDSRTTLKVFPAPSANVTLNVGYQAAPPTIQEGTDGVQAFPEAWRESVLLQMVILLEMKDKGEIDAMVAHKRLLEVNLYDMICTEQQGQPDEREAPFYLGTPDIEGTF